MITTKYTCSLFQDTAIIIYVLCDVVLNSMIYSVYGVIVILRSIQFCNNRSKLKTILPFPRQLGLMLHIVFLNFTQNAS